MLTEATRTTAVLFPVDEEHARENGPTFTGSIKLEGVSVPLSAFLKDAKNGTDTRYLDLSIGAKGQVHYSGRLFRNEKKGTKSPDYTGYLVILPMGPDVKNEHSDKEWEAAPRLTVFGRRARNADNSVRIALDVLPQRSNETVSDEEVGF
ncbi:hypothetical protein PTKU64_94170 (plasmid) [Paraburkholderia terrae]|uniref:Single-stranded DNA-binding protein n=1 Tax=Paraburkholderia terrae TaxID=311230 RepID=A0ABM7U343_9BURK|nr:hypothetical protein [Paraburkholderia terrae]BCZ85742.1 hypothetical protein PTKU64_94170 [Paraburkholderia terrae]